MEELIRFRLLVEKLTDEEFELFTLKLIQLYGKNIIISSLFDHFNNHNQKTNEQKQYTMTDITNIINQIINSRKKIKKDIVNNKKDKLSVTNIAQLPSNLISETASFLDMLDYHSFQMTNRIIYVSCNSPCNLKTLFIAPYNNHINFHHYPFIEDLSIDNISEFNHRINEQISIGSPIFKFNHVKILRISKIETDIDFDFFVNTTLDRAVNCDTVTTLFCDEFIKSRPNGGIDMALEFDLFMQLLSKFPNVRKIYLFAIFLTDFDQLENSKVKLPSNVTCVWDSGTVCGDQHDYFGEKFMNLYASQLTAISVSAVDRVVNRDIKYPLLEEVHIWRYPLEMEVFNNASNKLKRICMCTSSLFEDEKKEDIKRVIIDVILKQKLLEMIELYTDLQYIDTAVQAVEIGLFKTKLYKRNKFKVFAEVNVKDKFSWDEMLSYIRCALHSVASVSIDHFMIRFALSWGKNATAKRDIKNSNDMMKILSNQVDKKYYVNYFVYSESRCMISISNWESFMCSADYLLCD
eukprot:545986_1